MATDVFDPRGPGDGFSPADKIGKKGSMYDPPEPGDGPPRPGPTIKRADLVLAWQALDKAEECSGPESLDAAAALTHLADLYRHMDAYHSAAALCVRSLAIREKLLGPEHADTVENLKVAAELLYLLDDFTRVLLLPKRDLQNLENYYHNGNDCSIELSKLVASVTKHRAKIEKFLPGEDGSPKDGRALIANPLDMLKDFDH